MSSLFDLPFEDAPLDEPERPDERTRPLIYSVSALTHAVRQTVEGRFPRVWVEGEVADCTSSNGNVYFTLKDAGAQLSCVLWRTDAARVRFRLTTGMHVLVKGRLAVYVPRGRYQLVADALEPQGAGALQVAFEQLKGRLAAEGLFAAARKRPLPLLPRRVGIVTSLDGAALRDILRVLRSRRAPADIVIAPTRVQGEGAGAEIARAIRRIARVPDVDVVIVGRGGGSAEDLWAFNEEVVARALAACPVPVIAAVGHEVDSTIADFVADVRAATPSHAAELVTRQASDLRQRLAATRRQMALVTRGRVERRRTALLRLEQRPALAFFRDSVRDRERARTELRDRLDATLRATRAAQGRRLDAVSRRLADLHPQRQLVTRLRRLAQIDDRLRAAMLLRRDQVTTHLRDRRERLARTGLDGRVALARRRVDAAGQRAVQAARDAVHRGDRVLSDRSARLDALSPLKTLARGYAICWDAGGEVPLRRVADVRPGDRVHVQLTDGRLACDVDAVVPDSRSRT